MPGSSAHDAWIKRIREKQQRDVANGLARPSGSGQPQLGGNEPRTDGEHGQRVGVDTGQAGVHTGGMGQDRVQPPVQGKETKKGGVTTGDIIKADVKLHKYAIKHRKEIAGMFSGEYVRKYGNKTLAILALLTLIGSAGTAIATGHIGDVNWIEVGSIVAGVLVSFGVLGSRANGVASEEIANNPMNPTNSKPVPPTAMSTTDLQKP